MSTRPLLFCAALSLLGCGEPIPASGDADQPADASVGAGDLDKGCSPACSGLAPHCNATRHCVSCLDDSHCPFGSVCKVTSDAIATCVPGCTGDDRCRPDGGAGGSCCAAHCVDTTTDPANCGACGTRCAVPHAKTSCTAGACIRDSCEAGWGDCDLDAMNGCEANLHADPAHCTACGKACSIPNATSACADGCYATSCNWGFDDCNQSLQDGCETGVLADVSNCGACGKPCGALANATVGCVNGACALTQCKPGYSNCDANPANGCEVKTDTDVKNCGVCGTICPQGTVCTAGICTCPVCNLANAVSRCVNNQCAIDKCNPAYADCDGAAPNGCERRIDNDVNNCGACGNVCPMNMQGCANGVCTNAFFGLVAYWKFDGNPNDSIGNAHFTAPPQCQLVGFAPGKIGQASNAPMGDPQNLWLQTRPPVIDNNRDFTLAFWARNNATSWYDSYAAWDDGGLIVYRHQGHNWRWMMWVSEQGKQAINLDTNLDLPRPPDAGWTFVVVYRSGNTIGIRLNNGAPTTTVAGPLTQSVPLYVARNNAGYSWPGQLDEMGFWSRALTQNEQDLLYNNGNGRTFP